MVIIGVRVCVYHGLLLCPNISPTCCKSRLKAKCHRFVFFVKVNLVVKKKNRFIFLLAAFRAETMFGTTERKQTNRQSGFHSVIHISVLLELFRNYNM